MSRNDITIKITVKKKKIHISEKLGGYMKKIAQEIRKIRKSKGITLKKLSEKTELSISFLSQIERGISSMTITSLKKISDALGVTMQELLSIEDNQHFTQKKES